MKPLTIEQLKSLEVGDWVWIVIDNLEEELCCHTSYYKLVKKIHYDIGIDTLSFTGVEEDPELALSIYGTKWLAYKNKEQAESKGEIVELPCIRKVIADNMEKYHVYYIGRCGLYENAITYDWSDNYEQAKRHLAELKGEVNGGEEKYA